MVSVSLQDGVVRDIRIFLQRAALNCKERIFGYDRVTCCQHGTGEKNKEN